MDKSLVSKAKVAYHRNGVSGEGFHIITFHNNEDHIDMVGIVFEGSGQVAVFDRKLLGEGVIEFRQNSWRGDSFEPSLREVIAEWNKEQGYDD
jgi:hypothetical protein